VPDRRCPRGPAGEGAIGLRAGDAVRDQPAASLVAAKRDAGLARESPVDSPSAQSVSAEAELEHRHIPADRPDPELALAEQRMPASSERAPCPAADEPRRPNPVLPLEAEQRLRRQLPAYAVDRTGVEPVGPEPHLESGDASTGCDRARGEREDTNGHRDADDGEATHAHGFAGGFALPPDGPQGEPRLQSRGCLPR